MFFSTSTASHSEQRNARLLVASVQSYGFKPRATLLLSCVRDNRVPRKGAATPYLPIDPLDDFRKDVEATLPHLYTRALSI